MSDLKKLMEKLNKPDTEAPEKQPVAKAPVETIPEKVPEVVPEEELTEDEDEDDDDEDETSPQETEEGVEKEIHEVKEDQNSIEHEVALLQNDGVFRRELIITLKELVDVHKVNTQTLLDIKKKLIGDDGEKN